MADANGHVDVVFNETDDVIEKHHANIDLRISGKKREHDRRHMQFAKHDRGSDQEVAAGRAIFAGCHTFGLVELLKHAPTGRNESDASVGEQQFAAGADHELRAKTRLELRYVPADGRKRHAELTGGRRQAATVDRREQRPDRLEPIHTMLPFLESLTSET